MTVCTGWSFYTKICYVRTNLLKTRYRISGAGFFLNRQSGRRKILHITNYQVLQKVFEVTQNLKTTS